ncbi:M23 family metallopeptidase [Chengkuizengella axinellae]|uniref:M23 family metallopeptidase n=1 Tax=Chengkuizengella axinellae TaxID=3064388 RepID=A0ABT9IZG3_9BACL|nr:M23 family metallopeptidase [Chengkuizengella sp. 2205SS18-9]MDP5274761.1 M23 family metallopeptidase [Chengkuizengella sp. 2205SS18-9]
MFFWGGTNQFLNYHYVYENQRYAYDLIIKKDAQSYKGFKNKNENYYAFNKEILAPADGRVVKILDGIKDNVPGEMNENQPEGNCVIIEHKNSEFSMLAHLKQNSILVKVGEIVNKGQVDTIAPKGGRLRYY